MPRYLLTLRYVGTAYCGWQVQNNARSVQQTVQDAMESLLGVRPRLTGCSRTDAGVHAREFCAHFDAALPMPADRLPLALNTRLPDDVAALSCREVADDFHARYACEGKTYCYQILCSRLRDPFLEGYAWQVPYRTDQPLLDRAAGVFVGRHDFRGFCASGSSVTDTVRRVFDCHVEGEGEFLRLYITADGFLYNMVRIIAGTLGEVLAGRMKAEALPEILASGRREQAGPTAPPQGLFLEKVWYAGEKMPSRLSD